MDPSLIVVAILSYPVVAFITHAFTRKRLRAETVDLTAQAASTSVDTLLKSITRLEHELKETREEVRTLRDENKLLSAKVAILTVELEKRDPCDECPRA